LCRSREVKFEQILASGGVKRMRLAGNGRGGSGGIVYRGLLNDE